MNSLNQSSYWYLENTDLSQIFCPRKMEASMHQVDHKTFQKGEYIFLPGDNADKIYFIVEGRVKIGAYSDTGKEITKAIISEGEVFGELPLVGEEYRRNFAMSMENTTACVLSVEQMKGLMREHSPLNLFFMKILGNRVLEMEKRLESLVFKDSRSRVVEYLKELCETKGQRVEYEWVVRKFLTHQDIANITATSRQTVTTVLNDLENKNILTYNRRRMLVRDLDALASAAKEMAGSGH